MSWKQKHTSEERTLTLRKLTMWPCQNDCHLGENLCIASRENSVWLRHPTLGETMWPWEFFVKSHFVSYERSCPGTKVMASKCNVFCHHPIFKIARSHSQFAVSDARIGSQWNKYTVRNRFLWLLNVGEYCRRGMQMWPHLVKSCSVVWFPFCFLIPRKNEIFCPIFAQILCCSLSSYSKKRFFWGITAFSGLCVTQHTYLVFFSVGF